MLCLQPYWPGFLRRFYDVLRLAVAREIRCVRESNENTFFGRARSRWSSPAWRQTLDSITERSIWRNNDGCLARGQQLRRCDVSFTSYMVFQSSSRFRHSILLKFHRSPYPWLSCITRAFIT
ncbi:hypothetical protein Mp_4g13220 [Marchantia polymorpha subsp. ruderalis]|uniref:Uncharacterized protein n=2 Tax=Marchantia polymorpha TaxID=3197 RepID=A0AAF6B9G0_MARPO|nr:hypothetical protein MARPO_3368s0001 [Marchantia polymorpha]BBN08644.1 hypothetical protein Mp_4g13220 [Marchantia polymorpha subsp. ruderalis]|eukprot:PTQ26290.1 hypothetical protein MARPO_3368s0001 [Marchantia polymorpha]